MAPASSSAIGKPRKLLKKPRAWQTWSSVPKSVAVPRTERAQLRSCSTPGPCPRQAPNAKAAPLSAAVAQR
eukprot:6120142-Alexandrium_andersonii.AAC.1